MVLDCHRERKSSLSLWNHKKSQLVELDIFSFISDSWQVMVNDQENRVCCQGHGGLKWDRENVNWNRNNKQRWDISSHFFVTGHDQKWIILE